MNQHILANKWFIDTSGQEPLLDLTRDELEENWLPPQTRHDGSTLSDYTVDNDVTPLIDGENIMPAWHDGVVHLTQNHSNAQLLHSGWAMDNIPVKGGKQVVPLLDALLKQTDEVYVALSDHWFNKGGNRQMTDLIGVDTAATDSRYPDWGSAHAKSTVFQDGTDDRALVGSADLWMPARSQRSHQYDRQHEVSALLYGPAVADVQQSFIHRYNDSTRDDVKGRLRHWKTQTQQGKNASHQQLVSKKVPELSANSIQTQTTGTHAVQVLETFGIDHDDESYSWANGSGGEFTAWAARLRALSKATDYIYIEDQYFVPFADPGASVMLVPEYELAMKTGTNGSGYKWAPFTHLREKLEAGVDVFVVTNPTLDGTFANTASHARTEGLIELRDAAQTQGAGRFVVATMEVNGETRSTHSKLLLCDDEYVSLGSANFNRRSMTNDTELQLGIVDGDGQLVTDLRTDIWAEHLDVSASSLGDLSTAKTTFAHRVATARGRLRQLPIPDELPGEPVNQLAGINIWDHYGGPDDRTPEAEE